MPQSTGLINSGRTQRPLLASVALALPSAAGQHQGSATQLASQPPGLVSAHPMTSLPSLHLASPKHAVRFATLNTRTLSHAGSVEQLATDLEAAGVSVCGLQETRRRGHGQQVLTAALGQPAAQAPADWTLLWSGLPTRRMHGVGALLSPAASRSLLAWRAVSERLLCITLAGVITTTVLVAYAPTNELPLPVKAAFYTLLDAEITKIPAHHLLVILGDMNAQVGANPGSTHPLAAGHYGTPRGPRPRPPPPPLPAAPPPPPRASLRPPTLSLSHHLRNDNGRRCLELCSVRSLAITNTFYRHADKHTASFYCPTGKRWATLDLVMVNRRFLSSVLDTRVLPHSLSHSSDHRLVVCDIRLRLRSAPRPPRRPRYNEELLRHAPTRLVFQMHVSSSLSAAPQPAGDSTASAQLAVLSSTLHQAAGAALGPATRLARRRWITQPTAQLAGRKAAAWQLLQFRESSNAPEADIVAAKRAYCALRKAVQKACELDKAADLHARGATIADLMRHNQASKAWAELDAMTGRRPRQATSTIRAPDGTLVTGAAAAAVLAQHFESVCERRAPRRSFDSHQV